MLWINKLDFTEHYWLLTVIITYDEAFMCPPVLLLIIKRENFSKASI